MSEVGVSSRMQTESRVVRGFSKWSHGIAFPSEPKSFRGKRNGPSINLQTVFKKSKDVETAQNITSKGTCSVYEEIHSSLLKRAQRITAFLPTGSSCQSVASSEAPWQRLHGSEEGWWKTLKSSYTNQTLHNGFPPENTLYPRALHSSFYALLQTLFTCQPLLSLCLCTGVSPPKRGSVQLWR